MRRSTGLRKRPTMSSGRSEGGKRTGLASYTFEVFSCLDGCGSSHAWGGHLPHVLRVRARGDAVDTAARLTREPHVPPWSHGSLPMNHALMAAGLRDGLQMTIFPVITAITAITGQDPIPGGAAGSTSGCPKPEPWTGAPRSLTTHRPCPRCGPGDVTGLTRPGAICRARTGLRPGPGPGRWWAGSGRPGRRRTGWRRRGRGPGVQVRRARRPGRRGCATAAAAPRGVLRPISAAACSQP